MGAFLEDVTPFYGLKERNQRGQTLEEFLEDYDASQYQTPSVTADVLVFCHNGQLTKALDNLKLLLIQRGDHPGLGKWALPGGFVEMRENLVDGAKRELLEETGLKDVVVEQLRTWGNYDRDPRTRIITTSFMAVLEQEQIVKGLDDAADAAWMNINFKNITTDHYQLCLTNTERNIKLEAVIKVVEKRTGVIRDMEFQMIESKGLAFDHPCMIIDALLKLIDRL